jgi:hypothetical protein
MAENRTLKGIYGEAGAVFENGTTEITGEFCAITIIADAQFHTLIWPELTDNGEDGGVVHDDRKLAEDTDTGVTDPQTVPAGVTLYGQISKFKLFSGAVIAYKASK